MQKCLVKAFYFVGNRKQFFKVKSPIWHVIEEYGEKAKIKSNEFKNQPCSITMKTSCQDFGYQYRPYNFIDKSFIKKLIGYENLMHANTIAHFKILFNVSTLHNG